MNQVTEYYIVPKNVYEHVKSVTETEPTPEQERFNDIPISARKKVLILDEWLKNNNISVSDEVIAYAVRGRFKPVDWTENIVQLLEIPSHLLSLRANKEIRRFRLKKKKEKQ